MSYVLLATDASWVRDEVCAALTGSDTTVAVIGEGKHVVRSVIDRAPDLAVFDLQIGNMGGIATTMAVRNEETGGRSPHVPILILLDRVADVHLARRSGADGWIVKPLDSVRLRAAARALLAGGTYTEGLPTAAAAAPEPSGPVPSPTG